MFFGKPLKMDLIGNLLVFFLFHSPAIFQLNEYTMLHIFSYLSVKDRIRLETGECKDPTSKVPVSS